MIKQGSPALLHVVVSCKSRKNFPIPKELCISAIEESNLERRVQAWIAALEANHNEQHQAGDLYAGDHWKVVLRIRDFARPDLKIQLWVASAGYGLVAIDAMLKPYSATFVRGHTESVVRGADGFAANDWWNRLSQWSPGGSAPRTITDLARGLRNGTDAILLALSASYSEALADDLRQAALAAPGQIGLISAGFETPAIDDCLRDVVLPAEAKLKQVVGGAMQGVNARIAHRVVSAHGVWYPSMDRLRTWMTEMLDQTEPLPTFDRERMQDEDVRAFIKSAIAQDGRVSKSRLLRELRDSGRACEQARFGKLFADVTAGRSVVNFGGQEGSQ